MPEFIMTRANETASAIQFEGTQESFEEIQSWINDHNPDIVVTWNGDENEPGLLEIFPNFGLATMECVPGDWVIKSSRDTFYTVQERVFDEIWVVLH